MEEIEQVVNYAFQAWDYIGPFGRSLIYINLGVYFLKVCSGARLHVNWKRREGEGEYILEEKKDSKRRRKRLRWPTPLDGFLYIKYRMKEEEKPAKQILKEGWADNKARVMASFKSGFKLD